MSRVIAVEIAKSQIRVASIDSDELRAATARAVPEFDTMVGLSRDLGEMISTRTLLRSMTKLIVDAATDHVNDVEGIGIAISAAVDEIGIAHVTHQPGGVQEDFRDTMVALRKEFPNARQIILDNRSNLGAWGEYHLGWRQVLNPLLSDLLFITISGNVGGGIITGGRLLKGVKGIAGEIGHLVIDPNSSKTCSICGQNGCASKLASGRTLVEYVIDHKSEYSGLDMILGQVMEADGKSPMVDVGHRAEVELNGNRKEINSRAVLLAVRAGSDLARHAVDEMTTHLAKLIEDLAYILDPSMVILGGIAPAEPALETLVDSKVHLRAYAAGGHDLKTSLRGDKAALYGAALQVCAPRSKPEAQ